MLVTNNHTSFAEESIVSFLFKDEEFHEADFDVTAFVLKYQSVISLESLQQELKKYLESIRNRLYETVNRDYRDFIQIAMRLEGADVRLSLMQTPLLSLRSELNGLYDGLFSTLQAIQASVQSKQSFQERKAFLQLAVDCDAKLDAIESSMLIPSTSTPVQKATYPSSSEDSSAGSTVQEKGNVRMALYSRLRAIRNRDSPSQDEFNIYQCSEIERNAFDIAHFESLLSNLQLNTEESSAPAGCGYLDSIRTSLIEKIQSTRGKLLTRVKDRLSEMALNGVTSPFISTVSSPSPLSTALPLPFSHRSLTHLLRALLVLGEGVSFEMIIAEKVVHPLIRSVLTQSAIDGSLGGGSFSGLRDAMSALMHNIASRIENIAATCETELRGKPPIDIILRSVWLPVITFLDQRYGALLFASAIADTFHACYDAIHHFTKTSAGLAGEAQRFFVYKRLLRSDEVRSFQERWKVDLYMQVRGQEIFVRLDQHCSALLDLTLLSDPLPILPASLKGSLPISNEIYKLPIMTAFATELATCLHPSVYISSCSSKFLLLLSRICLRLEGLIALLLRSPTSSFPADMLQTLLAQAEGHLHGGIKLRLTVRELIILVGDFSTMLSWLMRDLCATAEACMIDELERKIVITGEADHVDDVTPVRKCFSLLHLRLTGVRGLVWKEVRHLLLLDCRDVLLLPVKSVASRFRMTNKPPPTAPSPYVENILNPLREFLSSYGHIIPEKTELWMPELVDAVAESFLAQVQVLMETVRQMDTALQRRSKLRASATFNSDLPPIASMSDSDKITLQLLLDAEAFEKEVSQLVGLANLPSACKRLLEELTDARRFIPR